MYFRHKDIQKTYAIWDHYLWLNGVGRNDRRARFSGRLGKNDPLYIELPLLNLRLYNSYRIQDYELAELLDSLKEWNPVLIEGYPSMISTVSKFIRKSQNNLSIPGLRMISVTAETLYEWDRKIIESAFNVKVHNQYASSEGSPFVAECAFGNLHLYLFSGIIRKVFDKEVYLVTSFRSSKVNLINYDVGDRFVLNEEDYLIGSNCKCGSIHPIVSDVLGRNDDYILDENQKPIQRLDIIYKGLYGIIESQIVQYRKNYVSIYIVPDTNWDVEASAKLVTNTRNLLGDSMNVEIKLTGSIEKGPNGKFRAVLNRMIK
jgi:phenylacetate-CoA ligase